MYLLIILFNIYYTLSHTHIAKRNRQVVYRRFGSVDSAVDDTHTAIEWALEQQPARAGRIFIIGWSMGGAVVLQVRA